MSCSNPLTADKIRTILLQHVHPAGSIDSEAGARRAAVLVPMLCLEDGWHILYTRRSEMVNDHKGQVSFPGGAIEIDDHSPEDAALREAKEEIGLDPLQVEILGRLDPLVSISRYMVIPVVGMVKWPARLSINSQEVSRVFTIPLDWLSMPEHYENRTFRVREGKQEMVYFFEPYDSEQLWGLSARITLQLLEVLGLLNGRSSSSLSHFPGTG